MDWKLELVRVSDELRFVQLTPPGSGCSISIHGPAVAAGQLRVGLDVCDHQQQVPGRNH